MVTIYVARCLDSRIGSRLLLNAAMEELHIPHQPLCHDDQGRPYLENGPDLSISHTQGVAAVALGEGPIGLDLERLRPIGKDLPHRVMSALEFQWFSARGSRMEDFFTLWTLKESFYKYLGTGLPGFPNKTQFICKDGQWCMENRSERFWAWQKNDLLMALCGHEQEVTLREITLEQTADSNPLYR